MRCVFVCLDQLIRRAQVFAMPVQSGHCVEESHVSAFTTLAQFSCFTRSRRRLPHGRAGRDRVGQRDDFSGKQQGMPAQDPSR